jgi:SSS family solute:Na+ symporter
VEAGSWLQCLGPVYVVSGQAGLELSTATDHVWRLDLAAALAGSRRWEPLPAIPGGPRAYPLVAAQYDGFDTCLYVIGGRRQRSGTVGPDGIMPLADCWELSPLRLAADPATAWRKRAAPPTPLMAGAAAPLGQSHVVVLAAADGSHLPAMASDPDFARRHPGFPRRAWAYHTITDTWTDAGERIARPMAPRRPFPSG